MTVLKFLFAIDATEATDSQSLSVSASSDATAERDTFSVWSATLPDGWVVQPVVLLGYELTRPLGSYATALERLLAAGHTLQPYLLLAPRQPLERSPRVQLTVPRMGRYRSFPQTGLFLPAERVPQPLGVLQTTRVPPPHARSSVRGDAVTVSFSSWPWEPSLVEPKAFINYGPSLGGESHA